MKTFTRLADIFRMAELLYPDGINIQWTDYSQRMPSGAPVIMVKRIEPSRFSIPDPVFVPKLPFFKDTSSILQEWRDKYGDKTPEQVSVEQQ